MQRVRRNNNPSTYKIETDRALYAVTIEKLTNTTYGQPRYKANVITLQIKEEPENRSNCYYTRQYQWTAATYSDTEEAAAIVNYIENEMKGV